MKPLVTYNINTLNIFILCFNNKIGHLSYRKSKKQNFSTGFQEINWRPVERKITPNLDRLPFIWRWTPCTCTGGRYNGVIACGCRFHKTWLCVAANQASSAWVVIPLVNGHPSKLRPSSMQLNCVNSKRSFYEHGHAVCVLIGVLFLQATCKHVLVSCTTIDSLFIYLLLLLHFIYAVFILVNDQNCS
jgi:hypothetical protein